MFEAFLPWTRVGGSRTIAKKAIPAGAWEEIMGNFVIAPHFRLQEWVAEEKGYFAAEGLDYEFREALDSSAGGGHQLGNKVGAYQTLEAGRSCNVSAACHWTMNVAASNGHGKLYAECYSVSPCGIFVPPGAPVETPRRPARRARA